MQLRTSACVCTAIALASGCTLISGVDDLVTGPGTGGGTSSYTLATICTELPPRICAQRAPCCLAAGLEYDEAGCVAYERSVCEADVADVQAGLMTFTPASIDACLALMAANLEQCFFSMAEALDLQADYALCRTIFQGQVAAGDPCGRDDQCAPPAGDGWAECESSICTAVELRPAGAECTIGTADVDAYCQYSLYCDADMSGSPPWAGICTAPTPLGSPCDINQQISLECGLEGYCDVITGICMATKPAGAACQTSLECESMYCPAGGGQCGELDPMVSSIECRG